jgi:hypothetical protein
MEHRDENMDLQDFSCMVCGGALDTTPTPHGLSKLQKSCGFICSDDNCPATFQYVALTEAPGKNRVVMLSDIRSIVDFHMAGMTQAWRYAKREEGKRN